MIENNSLTLSDGYVNRIENISDVEITVQTVTIKPCGTCLSEKDKNNSTGFKFATLGVSLLGLLFAMPASIYFLLQINS